MTRPILHVQRRNPHTLALTHHQIERKPLYEKLHSLLQTLPIQRMQHGMPGPIRRTRRPIRLPSLAVLETLPAQSALVYCALACAREGHAVVLELDDGGHGFPRHVVDCVLVAEPVGALDRIVHVPAPVVGGHVAERGVDATLCGDGVGARGEEFGHAGGF